MSVWLKLVLIALASACAIAPVSPSAIERWYSTDVYLLIQRTLTPVSNLVPLAVFDLLVVALAIAIAAITAKAVRAAWRSRAAWPIVVLLGRLVTTGALVYLLFLLLWGLNYRRVPVADRIARTAVTPTRESVLQLGQQAVSRVNALYGDAHRRGWNGEEWRDASLRDASATVQQFLSKTPPAMPGRLKHSLLGPYFRWTSVDAMINPFGLEVLANPDLLPFERPFVAAHEWAHLAGYADEAEAGFVGWLTCIRADEPAQYSGWLYLYWQVSGEVDGRDRRQLADGLAAGPRADVAAIVARIQRGQLPLLRDASWRIYDQYLKANRVEEGIRSYDKVVMLILQARFEDGWVPVRRQ